MSDFGPVVVHKWIFQLFETYSNFIWAFFHNSVAIQQPVHAIFWKTGIWDPSFLDLLYFDLVVAVLKTVISRHQDVIFYYCGVYTWVIYFKMIMAFDSIWWSRSFQNLRLFFLAGIELRWPTESCLEVATWSWDSRCSFLNRDHILTFPMIIISKTMCGKFRFMFHLRLFPVTWWHWPAGEISIPRLSAIYLR